MRQIFENVWEVDIRRKNMWFQRKSRTERRKFPRIILLILLACLMFVKLCEGLLSVSRLVAPWSAPQRMMSAPKETIGLQNTWADLWFFLLFPHIFVWGSCFWLCTPACLLLPPAASHTQLTHTQLTRTQLVNTQRAHTQLAHTQLTHTQLSRTHNLPTHNLLVHNLLTKLNHTHNLSTHNLFTHHILTHHILTHNLPTHNWLTHNLLTRNLPTHNLLTHSLLTHNLSTHTHTPYSHTSYYAHTRLDHTQLGHIDLHFAWQAWHLATSTFTLRFIDVHSAWQVCVTLRGRRGTWRHRPPLCVAGAALMLKGSCHRDESSINHTLAQNSHCEFWCGMHLTCTNTND